MEAFRAAAELEPDEAVHWAALGFALDQSDLPEEAIVVFRRAHEVDPDDEEVEVFVLTLLSELGPEDEAMAGVEALAKRKGVDLESIRQELSQTDMPADARALLMNGFLRARNFLRSTLQDAIDKSQRRQDPNKWAHEAESERQECLEMQEGLQNEVDPDRVPAGLRDVTPWAVRLGLGDDVCRPMLVDGLSAAERTELLSVIQKHATSIHSWLDGFGDKPMPPEAAAFMYLLLGVEETDTPAS